MINQDWSTAFWGSALLIPEHISFSMLFGALLRWGISEYTLGKSGQWYPDPDPGLRAGNSTPAVDTAVHCDKAAAVFATTGVQVRLLAPLSARL